MREVQSLFSLNRGIVSRYGIARLDIKRIALAAETQTNWVPKVLGQMVMRPGLKYIGTTLSNAAARFLKFIFSTTDTALIEVTENNLRILINDVVLTRPAVSTSIVNGTFATDLSGWTDSDEAGTTSSWAAPNYMQLVGNGSARAMREQTVVVSSQNIEHALKIVIVRGPVTLRVGSSSGGDDYVRETSLGTGTHSLAFTPTTSNFYIQIFSTLTQIVWVSQCTVESSGVVNLPAPWAAADLGKIRYDQSGDVVFLACTGYQQRRIERRGTGRSWSIVTYQPIDGPFMAQNFSNTTLTASAISGNITISASLPVFNSSHVGALFAITSAGQQVSTSSSVSGTNTNSIRVIGVGESRSFRVVITGDASSSIVNMQRSFDDVTWFNVPGQSFSTNADQNYLDGLENQIVYYRLQLTTRVAPDTVTMQLQFGTGTIRGVVRITGYSNTMSVAAEVLSDLGGTAATSVWQEGSWSDYRGWPSSVAIHEGRMWWAGKNGIWGSVSDSYDSFDETYEGDAGTINRTIGAGPVDIINWIMSLKGLMVGSQGSELSVRASSLDEILTPTNFNMKSSSTQGSGSVGAAKVDQRGYFVNRSGMKMFAIDFDARTYDYTSQDAMELCPELGYPGILRIDTQRNPDTRIHCVRSDGKAVVAVVNVNEDVMAWFMVETDGVIEDVVTLPSEDGNLDDQVYYVVKRTINGSTVRYLEKWAQEIDCRGDQQYCYLADSHILYSGVRTNVISGLDHLEGENVVVWADGLDVGTDTSSSTWTQTYTVSGGQITLAAAAATVVVGLPYTATFKSAKLGSLQAGVSSLNQQKRISKLGLMLADCYKQVPRFGPEIDYLDDMPLIENGTEVADGTQETYDENMFEFPGIWTTNSRVCLVGYAPRPCTVMAVTMDEVQH